MRRTVCRHNFEEMSFVGQTPEWRCVYCAELGAPPLGPPLGAGRARLMVKCGACGEQTRANSSTCDWCAVRFQ